MESYRGRRPSPPLTGLAPLGQQSEHPAIGDSALTVEMYAAQQLAEADRDRRGYAQAIWKVSRLGEIIISPSPAADEPSRWAAVKLT